MSKSDNMRKLSSAEYEQKKKLALAKYIQKHLNKIHQKSTIKVNVEFEETNWGIKDKVPLKYLRIYLQDAPTINAIKRNQKTVRFLSELKNKCRNYFELDFDCYQIFREYKQYERFGFDPSWGSFKKLA